MTLQGGQIVAFRKAHKISRKAMAEQTGLTEARIANLEKGSQPRAGEFDLIITHYPLISQQEIPQAEPAPQPQPESAAPPADTSPPAADGTAACEQPVVALSEDELEEEGEAMADVIAFPGAASTVTPQMPASVYEDHITDFDNRDDGLRRISNGELQTFKRCKRKWWLAYYRRLGLPVDDPVGARSIGTRIHNALMHWYVPDGTERGDPFAILEAGIAEDFQRYADDPFKLEAIRKDADLCRAMLEGYFQWLAETGADEGLRITAAETKLEVDPGIEGVRLIAKIDVRAVREQDQARRFLDHKTVGNLTEPLKTIHMDEQMLHYHLCEYLDMLASGQEGEHTDGAIYNMLRKVKRTERAKPPFYDRIEVRHNVETLRSYWTRVVGIITDIQQLEAKLAAGWDHKMAAYPSPRGTCSWDCDFVHVCIMFDDGSRVEDYIANTFVTINPLKRYETTDRSHES